MNFSVAILTLNEEHDLPAALASVAACDDVVVFDSFSTDKTCEIARAGGARVSQRRFDNYASHRNAALAVDYRHPWVLMLDADERVPADLLDELSRVTAEDDPSISLYRLRRKDMFCGKWIKHSSCYPTWFARLMRVGKARFIREINEDVVSDGKTAFLQQHLVHYPFSKGVAYWVDRHNRYSTMEARAMLAETAQAFRFRDIFSINPVLRRRALKQLAYRMPLRPMIVFIYLYFARFGCLDGRAGLSYCFLRTFYEFMIDLKASELRRQDKGLQL